MVQSILNVKLFLFILFMPVLAYSQQKCGSVEQTHKHRQSGLLHETDTQFEEWLNEKVIAQRSMLNDKRVLAASYQLQVVVHIIHNDELVGQGANISDAQINSQLSVLNKDFKRQNADAVNTPIEFQPLAGAVSIDFVLAQTDPNGNPTTGINRVKGTKTSWMIDDETELKSLSYWPAENYINIWVCDLTDAFGYGQVPVSTLKGIENSSKNRLTDGLIISYDAFGSIDDGSFALNPKYNKGRTATHEMGHFFGLRHLWGDEINCKGTDYVKDTSPQANATLGCPAHPQKECPVDDPVNKMFQNYLDYTDDACMNLFTKGQVERMIIVLENSPRRASLLLPLALEQPEVQFPKIFSPNGDGINDFWRWTNTLDYDGCDLTIYNRFGQLVYKTISYDNSWDGRTNLGQALETEAYYYIIKCDGKKEITGGLRIVR